MCWWWASYRNRELALVNALSNGLDAVYLVSHKALAEQKFRDFATRFSAPQWASSVTVGISTGEHEEGEVNCRLSISTYEKALGLMLAGRLRVRQTLVIADELQIIGEAGRGPSVEVLCALLRQHKPHQFVGLTATVENPQDLAAWMGCQVVRSEQRDIDLLQTVIYNKQEYTVRLGEEDGTIENSPLENADLHTVIRRLVENGLGPVLVFTESRREAADLASSSGWRSRVYLSSTACLVHQHTRSQDNNQLLSSGSPVPNESTALIHLLAHLSKKYRSVD